jgi:hypothetical protein
VTYGQEGDELVVFHAADSSQASPDDIKALLRVCSKAARPNYSASKAISEFFKDAQERGWGAGEFRRLKLGGRTWLIEKRSEPRSEALYRETDDYVLQVNGDDEKLELAVLNGITQPSRRQWERTLARARAQAGAPDSYAPDLAPPKAYSSPLGFSIDLPEGYTLHRKRSRDAEIVFLIPLRHAALMTDAVLDNALEFPHFAIVRLEAGRRGDDVPGAYARIRNIEEELKKNGLQDKELRFLNAPNGDWTLELLSSPRLRYSAWESGGLLLQMLDGDRALGDRVRGLVR